MPEDYLIPDMESLGLDPAQIKYICITHAGPDHLGGAKYFQDTYGTQIVMSHPEWDKMPTDGSTIYDFVPPVQNIVGTDGMELTLGDTTVTMIYTPRTVAGGGLTYLAPVYDNGEPHMWMTYGNTGISGDLADKEVFRESVAKALACVEEYNVDVLITPVCWAAASKVSFFSSRILFMLTASTA